MKPKAAPYDENAVEESDDAASTEGSERDEPDQAKPPKEAAASAEPQLKCEIKEFETRPGLKGELQTKEVKAKPNAAEDGDKETLCAMKAHKTYDREGNLTNVIFEIFSPHLRGALRTVIKEYPGQHFGGDVVYLSGSSEASALGCLFHYRRELEAYAQQQAEVEAKMHIRLALKYIGREFRQAIRRFETRVLAASEGGDGVEPSVEFRDLWMLFKPGILLLGRPRHAKTAIYEAYRITLGSCDNTPCWNISTKMFGHNGESFGYLRKSFRISRFDGTLPVTKLDIYPLRYSREEEKKREEQIKRAKKYLELTGFHYRSYTGKAWGVEHKRTPTYWGGVQDEYPDDALQLHADRIILDPIAFAENMTDQDIKLHETKTLALDADVSNDDLLICNFEIAGFSLREKRWCWFLVDRIHDIEFDDSAFANLLLPSAQTRLVRALTRQQTGSGGQCDNFDDVIANKGKGCIFLLHGPPGVGKTATVESVSDELRRPLYVMMSGDLGSAVEAVERNLQKVLRLVVRWKAVLLIDEADVFLERRSAHDLARNSLVSIFLRLLEYFAGIMFLTTNRVDSLDQAFQSRIHLTLAYKPLDVNARSKLWRFFLARADKAAATSATNNGGHENAGRWPDQCIDAFAQVPLNGRQIKNAVRTAQALARSEGRRLSPDDVQVVLDTVTEFEKDFKPRPSTPDLPVVMVNGFSHLSNGTGSLS